MTTRAWGSINLRSRIGGQVKDRYIALLLWLRHINRLTTGSVRHKKRTQSNYHRHNNWEQSQRTSNIEPNPGKKIIRSMCKLRNRCSTGNDRFMYKISKYYQKYRTHFGMKDTLKSLNRKRNRAGSQYRECKYALMCWYPRKSLPYSLSTRKECK